MGAVWYLVLNVLSVYNHHYSYERIGFVLWCMLLVQFLYSRILYFRSIVNWAHDRVIQMGAAAVVLLVTSKQVPESVSLTFCRLLMSTISIQ
jgi:hypothetical protein